MHSVRAAAESFARAFDANDLPSLGALLAPACEFGAVEAAHGREAVVARLLEAHAWAERVFDDVRHESLVAEAEGDVAQIDVTTYLMRVPGRWHRFRRRRELRFDAAGAITRIEDSVEPAAAEAMRAFVASCAAPPPPDGWGV